MKKGLRFQVLVFAVMLIMASFTTAFAASEVKEFDCQYSGKNGGGTRTFYVKTGSGSKNQIVFTMTKGTIWPCPQLRSETVNVYGSYEIKVYYKSGNSWILETPANTDIYYKSSYTYSFKRKNTVYKVSVWNWRATTMITSYIRKSIIPGAWEGFTADMSTWKKLPSCNVKNKTGCKLYSNCP